VFGCPRKIFNNFFGSLPILADEVVERGVIKEDIRIINSFDTILNLGTVQISEFKIDYLFPMVVFYKWKSEEVVFVLNMKVIDQFDREICILEKKEFLKLKK